jgi:hypothetical protein
MANYFDNFSGYAVATGVPTGFTARWVTTSVTHSIVSGGADKFFRQNRSGTGRGLVTIDAVDGDSNRALADVLVRVKLNNPSGGTAQAGPAARCSGSAGSETGYVCYPVSNKLRVAAYKAGASSTILESATLSLTDGAWYWIRLRVEATTSPVTLRARIWADGSGEPGTWNVNTTDSSSPITGAGWCGMFAFGATTWDTDDLAVATNGDTASMSGGGGSQTLTATLYTNDPVFYTHAIAQPGSSQTLTASLYSNTSVFYNHSLSIPGSDPSLTLGPLKNNTGTLLASQSSITVYVYTLAGALVTTKTGQSTDGSGIISFTDSAMTASTMYRAVIVMSGGAEGMVKATAV